MAPSDDDKQTKGAARSGSAKPRRSRAGSERPDAARTARTQQASDPPAAAERGVLTNLPSTRPQHPSARRAAARNAAAKTAGTTNNVAKPVHVTEPIDVENAAHTRVPTDAPARARRSPRRTATTPKRPPRQTAPPQEPRIPPQGFETEEEIAPGSTVQPPSRPELAAAVADLLGELAQGGLTAGGRLLRDFLGKLPGV